MTFTRHQAVRAATATIFLASAAAVAAIGGAPVATAGFCDPLLNGNFSATSDGVWAKTNDIYHDEKTVTDTWAIETACTPAGDCAGTIASSQGWKAPIVCESAGLWHIRRHLDQWEPCSGGTPAPGDQLLYFSPDLSGSPSFDAVKTFSGWNRTVGTSGNCGINEPLVIEMPLQVTLIQ